MTRAITLLKLFSDHHPEWSLADLTRRTGLNKTTVYRLLSTLESAGLLARNKEKETYTLGSEVIALGGRALRSNNLRTVSAAELRSIAEAVRETCTLEILSGKNVMILDEIVGDHLVSGVPMIGTRWPAFATSTGKAILTYMPEEVVETCLKPPLPQITPRTVTSPDALRTEFSEIREAGYSVAVEELELGFSAVASVVRNHDGEVVAAISAGGPSMRFTSARIAEMGKAMFQAAARISAKLGYRA